MDDCMEFPEGAKIPKETKKSKITKEIYAKMFNGVAVLNNVHVIFCWSAKGANLT